MKTAVCLALFYLLTCQPAHAVVDLCLKPDMPPACQPKDMDNMGEHIRCLVQDRQQLLDFIGELLQYQDRCMSRKMVTPSDPMGIHGWR